MKKLFLFALTMAMVLNLAACGEDSATSTDTSKTTTDSVTLVDVTTDQGFGLKLPSDITLQTNNKSFANMKTADVVSFAAADADPASPLSSYSKEDFIANELADRENLVVSSFDNNRKINGKPALVCKFSFKADSGDITAALVLIDDNTKEYIVSFLYPSENVTGSLAKNLDACIESIVGIA